MLPLHLLLHIPESVFTSLMFILPYLQSRAAPTTQAHTIILVVYPHLGLEQPQRWKRGRLRRVGPRRRHSLPFYPTLTRYICPQTCRQPPLSTSILMSAQGGFPLLWQQFSTSGIGSWGGRMRWGQPFTSERIQHYPSPILTSTLSIDAHQMHVSCVTFWKYEIREEFAIRHSLSLNILTSFLLTTQIFRVQGRRI